jgi:hypothetical protein
VKQVVERRGNLINVSVPDKGFISLDSHFHGNGFEHSTC